MSEKSPVRAPDLIPVEAPPGHVPSLSCPCGPRVEGGCVLVHRYVLGLVWGEPIMPRFGPADPDCESRDVPRA